MLRMIPIWLLTVVVAVPVARSRAAQPSSADVEFFEKKIRPVLVQQCYSCHSKDAKRLKGGLFVDSLKGLTTGGDSGAAIVPGNPDKSLFITALTYEDEFLQMPPKKKLPEPVINDFRQWIKQGAFFPGGDDGPAPAPTQRVVDLKKESQFWSFQPAMKRPAPKVKNTSWVRDPIDAFILAKLEANKLAPANRADKRTLIRRATFDLTGMPPTVDEINAFLVDDSADAFEKVVDRLLNSPRFGERWAQHWLDLARYADTNGGDFNATFYNAWRYRNYVIDAFNRDKPYDLFIHQQIAGDLLPYLHDDQRTENLIATGFLALGTKMLSERDKEKLQLDITDEQIDSVGKVFMGMTLGCARCHDHKFDPILQSDYYALAGIFQSTVTIKGESQQYVSAFINPALPIDPEHAASLDAYKKTTAEITSRIKKLKKDIDTIKKGQMPKAKMKLNGVVVDDAQAKLVGKWKKSTHVNRYIGQGYIHDEKLDKGKKSVTWTPKLPKAGEYEVRLSFAASTGRDAKVPVTINAADGEHKLYLDQTKMPPIDQLWKPIGRFRFDKGSAGWVRISTEGTTNFVLADGAQFIPVEDLKKKPAVEKPVKNQGGEELQSKLAALEKQLKNDEAELAALKKNAPKPAPTALGVQDREKVDDCAFRVRGVHSSRGDKIARGFLAVLGKDGERPVVAKREQSGRVELAGWITSRENPLTARVMVNRIWMHLLGEGIVRTMDNFGTLGDRPSHPQLLNTLAVEFMEQGWSTKKLIRRIMLSNTYQMAVQHRENAFMANPDNRLLWRANRRRLSAEEIRDALLAVSGQLEEKPVESVVAHLKYIAVDNNNQSSSGLTSGAKGTRSIYLPLIRNFMPSILLVFDFADRDMVVGKRPVTTVPAQALLLLNNSFVKQAAGKTAEQLLKKDKLNDEQRVDLAYQLVLSRQANADETQRVLAFVSDHVAAGKLAEGVETEKRTVQAWSQFVQTLFASTEFRMLD